MTVAMRYRDVERALLAHGCTWKQGKGDHEKWYCPCGKHMAVATTGRIVSPGVVADVITKLSCLPKGWLQ
jgi:predicted RNA binding protein YcfA (HicA-like mRNA interferase family)